MVPGVAGVIAAADLGLFSAIALGVVFVVVDAIGRQAVVIAGGVTGISPPLVNSSHW